MHFFFSSPHLSMYCSLFEYSSDDYNSIVSWWYLPRNRLITILCSITVPRRSSHICTQQHLPHGTIIIIIIILVKPINERAVCKRYIIICAHCRRVRRYLRRRRTLKSCSYRAALVVRFLTKDVQFVRARKELRHQCTTAFNITYILQFISHAAASID